MKKKDELKKGRDYYKELDKAISDYENYRYQGLHVSWITDRISWCWKFRKITEQQKDELCNRMIDLFKQGVLRYY